MAVKDPLDVVMKRFDRFAEVVPLIEERLRLTYPDGSYERVAFERMKAMVPLVRHLRKRLTELDGDSALLEPSEKQQLHRLATTLVDARALLQETDFDTQI